MSDLPQKPQNVLPAASAMANERIAFPTLKGLALYKLRAHTIYKTKRRIIITDGHWVFSWT
jgi:hypothetical protein